MLNGIDIKAALIAIGLVLALGWLVWIAANLRVLEKIKVIETRISRIEVLQEAHMEGHPQTVREMINQHMLDRTIHSHGP